MTKYLMNRSNEACVHLVCTVNASDAIKSMYTRIICIQSMIKNDYGVTITATIKCVYSSTPYACYTYLIFSQP